MSSIPQSIHQIALFLRGSRCLTVIYVGNKIIEPTSHPWGNGVHFTSRRAWIYLFYFLIDKKIVRQDCLFALVRPISLGKGKIWIQTSCTSVLKYLCVASSLWLVITYCLSFQTIYIYIYIYIYMRLSRWFRPLGTWQFSLRCVPLDFVHRWFIYIHVNFVASVE